MKPGRNFFVKLPQGYEVEVWGYKKKIDIKPTGLFVTYDNSSLNMQYAGEDAEDSYAKIELPSDPKVLKSLAKELNKVARELSE